MLLGYQANDTHTTADDCVYIGHNAGTSSQNTTDDNQLYIARTNTAKGNAATWIYGNGVPIAFRQQ